ncbi:hypothetical protein GJ496_011715 [Pomphorhynchus laevis]|nr:hypothetical protein GJ496_011715 [Pomphorhynchus laevis]
MSFSRDSSAVATDLLHVIVVLLGETLVGPLQPQEFEQLLLLINTEDISFVDSRFSFFSRLSSQHIQRFLKFVCSIKNDCTRVFSTDQRIYVAIFTPGDYLELKRSINVYSTNTSGASEISQPSLDNSDSSINSFILLKSDKNCNYLNVLIAYKGDNLVSTTDSLSQFVQSSCYFLWECLLSQ